MARPPDRTPADIRDSFRTIAPVDPALDARRFEGEPRMTLVDLSVDVLVAGGGPAGVCAALAAARNGAKVLLVQDRSRLGGNSSSEVKMHVVGANNHTGRPGWREGGIIEELRLDDAANNPQRSWELWDLLLYDKVVSEPNITLLLDTAVYAVEVAGRPDSPGDGPIRQDRAPLSDRPPSSTSIAPATAAWPSKPAPRSAGVTSRARSSASRSPGPSRLARPSAAASCSPPETSAGRCRIPPPKWARKIDERQLRFRPISSFEYGYWWIEWGGATDTIRDNERIRFELLAIVTGVWDYIKNSGKYPHAANWAMDWVGMVPGKRESRRIEGDHILTQQDLMGLNGDFKDAVALGGWGLDEHPPGGFDDVDKPPFVSTKLPDVYNIPLRSLYSKDLANLMMAGRNASCSHVAFTSTRVMATCAVMGQAAGTAAALCVRHGLTPRQLYQDGTRLGELQQTLLRDDQTIKDLRNEDPADLAEEGDRHGLGFGGRVEARERHRRVRPRRRRLARPPLGRADGRRRSPGSSWPGPSRRRSARSRSPSTRASTAS